MEEKDKKKPKSMMKLKLKELADQVIVITGASSGIGLTTARMAAEKGAKVVVVSRNEEALQDLVNELEKKGQTAVYVKADVGVEEDIKKVAETAIREFGKFDTWVNVAGISIFGNAMDVSIEDMKKMFDTVYWGVVYGSRTAVEHFKDKGEPSALINVGSLMGDKGAPIQSTYSSAKFAVHGWTENLRMELEKDHVPVSVTLIHPGRIDTPYNEHAKSYIDKQPGHRGMIYPPEAVAEAILFSAHHPKRDMYVGGQAKLFEVLGNLFPRLTNKIEEFYLYPTQHANRPSDPKEDSALHEASNNTHQRGTHAGWKRKSSLYVKAQKHPVATLLIFAGVGAAAGSGTFFAVKKTTKSFIKMEFKKKLMKKIK